MRAFVIQKPGSCGFEEAPEPRAEAGQVLLRIDTLGFCGTDLNTFRGRNPLVSFPRIPGHEIGAEIIEVGREVPERFRPGMRVTVLPFTGCGRCRVCSTGRENCCQNLKVLGVQKDGAFQPYLAQPWQKLYPSETLSFAELALVEPLTIGFHAVARAQTTAADVVLVLGCGTIGIAAIAGAAAHGAQVIGLDLAQEKFPLARAAGATHTLDASREDAAALLSEWTQGEGPSVVIEAVGTPQTFRQAVDLAGHGARVAYVGWTKVPVEYDASRFVFKELDILGSRNSRGQFPAVMRYLESGRFPVDLAITRTVSFDESGEALRAWDADPSRVNKIQVRLPHL